MLTRDFTWSRNLSQEFAVSRSRPAWVAVVIGREKKNLCYFHRCEKTVERKPVHVIVSGFGMFARTGTFFVPLSLRSRPVRGCRPAYCRSKTARDCRRLVCAEQAKSVRKDSRPFTRHTQFFHKHKYCAASLSSANFRGVFQYILSPSGNPAQNARNFRLRKTRANAKFFYRGVRIRRHPKGRSR